MSVVVRLVDLFGGAIVSLPVIMILAVIFDKEKVKSKGIWIVLFILYMNAMLIIVGVPAVQYMKWNPEVNIIPFQDFSSSNITGMILNIVMLVPFGFLVPVCFDRYRKWHRTLIAGCLMSVVIEVVQLFAFRATDIDDVIMNTIGTAVGYVVANLFVGRKKADMENNKDTVRLVAIIAIVMVVIVVIRYPLVGGIYSVLRI